MPVFQLPEEYVFPNPELAEPDGLLAIGGDLDPRRLLIGYAMGLFPWYNPTEPILWWSPDPRMVIFPDKFHCSKNLQREIKSKKFEVRFDSNFSNVIRQCGATRIHKEGTWVSEDIIEAYTILHQHGFAHSVEIYENEELVGGLYGVTIGKIFFGESMFHTVTNASKVAFYYLVEFLKKYDFLLIDTQMETDHLRSLGAETIPRKEFLQLLEEGIPHETLLEKWKL